MSLAADFKQWALDPSRTNDELFTVELLIDWGRVVWGWKHQQPKVHNWDKEQAHRKERRLNPAYRSQLKLENLDATVEIWGEVTRLHYTSWEDRPIRDLTALRFFPHLEELHLNDVEVADLSPLARLRMLTSLILHEPLSHGGHVITDLTPLEGLPSLRRVNLSLRRPWPNLTALGKLPALKSLTYSGNVLALRDVPSIPLVERATLNSDINWKTPLRDLHDLPDMPEVRLLKVDGVASLRGLERFPRLLNVDLVGPYRDLEDVEALQNCTYLRLEGEQFSNLSPTTRMPVLRELLLVRERPLDLAPLTDAPQLREVNVERCSILRTELSALSATMLSWDDDFLAQEPRPLKPLRFLSYNPGHDDIKKLYEMGPPLDPRTAFYGMDEAFARAESRWFCHTLQGRLDDLLGKGWGSVSASTLESPGNQHLTFRRFRDVMRFRDIIEVLRSVAVTCRFGWHFLLSVEPHGDLSDDEAFDEEDEEEREDWLDQEFDPEREKEEWDDFRRQRQVERERMEREHRLQILTQQGAEIDPAQFSPASEPAKSAPTGEGESEDDETNDFATEDEDDEEGDLAEGESEFEDDEESLDEELSFVVSLDEDVLWVTDHMREPLQYVFGETPEDWHALPEPLERRPRPM